MKKIILIIFEEIRNQLINLMFVLIIDFFVICFDKFIFTFLFNFTFLQYNYITLTISFIIFLAFLPWLLPYQTDLMLKYNKRSKGLKKYEPEKPDNEKNA